MIRTVVRISKRFGHFYAEVHPKPAKASPRVADAATLTEVQRRVSVSLFRGLPVEVDPSAQAVAS